MFYQFPFIRTIDDVLPHIKNEDGIKVFDRGDVTIIDYVYSSNQVFPPVVNDGNGPPNIETAAMRRECRGLIFDKQGHLLRRPYHKFFNAGERHETLPEFYEATSEPYVVYEKLDGSMVAPYRVNGEIHFGTRMGETEIAIDAHHFALGSSLGYMDMIKDSIESDMTPIFEWCSASNKVCLDYGEPKLTVTAIRSNAMGTYALPHQLGKISERYNVPIARISDYTYSMLRTDQAEVVSEEGWVVRYNNGHMLKFKTEWYVALHKLKDMIASDRDVIRLILDSKLDDVLPDVDPPTAEKLTKFQAAFMEAMNETVRNIIYDLKVTQEACNKDRKKFALEFAPHLPSEFRTIYFGCWNDPNSWTINRAVRDMIYNNMRDTKSYDKVAYMFNYVRLNP